MIVSYYDTYHEITTLPLEEHFRPSQISICMGLVIMIMIITTPGWIFAPCPKSPGAGAGNWRPPGQDASGSPNLCGIGHADGVGHVGGCHSVWSWWWIMAMVMRTVTVLAMTENWVYGLVMMVTNGGLNEWLFWPILVMLTMRISPSTKSRTVGNWVFGPLGTLRHRPLPCSVSFEAHLMLTINKLWSWLL